MASAGSVAVEAQLASVALRHIQARFGAPQITRGDGWVLLRCAPITAENTLGEEIQRLCVVLVREVTGRSKLSLKGEKAESDFSEISSSALAFTKLIAKFGDVASTPKSMNDLPDLPAVRSMLELLYRDVASDVSAGVVAVSEFPSAMCPTGTRFDVLLKRSVCVTAFSGADIELVPAASSRLDDVHRSDDSASETGAGSAKPPGPQSQFWINTRVLADALSTYSNVSLESELPTEWRAQAFTLAEVREVLQLVYEVLVGYWNQQSHTERTRVNAMSFLSIVTGELKEFIKSQMLLQHSDWRGPWLMSLTDLRHAFEACELWGRMVQRLTTKGGWRDWEGGAFHDESFDIFASRLKDVCRIREVLLSVTQLKEKISDSMQPDALFSGVRLTDLSSSSCSAWSSCVANFKKEFSFLEPKLRNRVKQLFANPLDDGRMRMLVQHRTLLQQDELRDAIEKDLGRVAEHMIGQLDQYRSAYDRARQQTSTPIQKLRAARSCQAMCGGVGEQARLLFGEASPHLKTVVSHARDVSAAAAKDAADVMAAWCSAMEPRCSQVITIEDAVTVQVVGETNLLRFTVAPSVTAFLEEVRCMRCWCGLQDAKALEMSEGSTNAIRACEQLVSAAAAVGRSISNYNTVLRQILPCTKSMLLPAIRHTLSQILYGDTPTRVISLTNYQELSGLNLRFQNAVDALSRDNRLIRRFHRTLTGEVMALYNVDLTRHMNHWRTAVDNLRTGFEDFLLRHRFEPYDDWRRHWDCQIYKALEYQYCRGLEGLHESMETFKVEVVFKQGVVQLKPSFEAVREAYYIKLREFVSVPLRFRGLQPKRQGSQSYEFYPVMPVVNRARIATVHTRAVELFAKLNRVRRAFRSHVIIGLCGTNAAPDLDSIVEGWAMDGRRFMDGLSCVRERRQKMELIEDVIVVDCFSLSTIPVKASIAEQLHRLEDSLLNAMRHSMQATISEVDAFIFTASNAVERQPTTMDEVGEANQMCRSYFAQLKAYEVKLEEVEAMNKELRSLTGATLELGTTKTNWDRLREAMASHTQVIEASVSKMRVSLDGMIQRYLKDVQRFAGNWNKQKALLLSAYHERRPEKIHKSLSTLKDQMQDLDDLRRQAGELGSKCAYFNQPQPNFVLLTRTVADVESTAAMWSLYDAFEERLDALRQEDWLTFRSHTYLFDDFCKEWRGTLDRHLTHDAAGKENPIADYLLSLLSAWAEVPSLLKVVRGDGWMTEHWNELFRLLDIDKGRTSTTLTFGDILDHYEQMIQRQKELRQLHDRAHGEVQLREALQDLRAWALDAKFSLITPADGGAHSVKLITDWKDTMTQVSENQALVSSLKDSPFYVHFADEAAGWETQLVSLAEALVLLNSIQRKWTYLEPIFSRGALPQEQARFKRVNTEFVGILREVEADPRVMSLATEVDFNERLRKILEQMERCQKSLMAYLEAKRDRLPRFYFISDEDLLEILGHSQNPDVIQTHLKKLFMGIHSVEFNAEKTAITCMVSADGERVELENSVAVTDKSVEDWLIRLDDAMKATLRNLLVACVAEENLTSMEVIQRYPSQILQVALQIVLTAQVEAALPRGAVAEILSRLQHQLQQLTGAFTSVDEVTGLKVKALILDIIHNIDVCELLVKENVRQPGDWWWQKQLRYQMDSKQSCTVHMADTVFDYTYEYQGNAAKLVHTPLTDKCYLVLTKGMGLGYGGNPYGPAGTGKTESVKALGSAMGRQVLVFNCDEGIDFKAMGRIFVGIIKCGAWGCFDEFNRLKIDQLSAISQMIQIIQEALKLREPSCLLMGHNVDVDSNAGIFVTMNPAGKGYGGRTKLPDNLKQLFREVAMSVPDNELITSTMLLSEGFRHGKTLARNVVELYKLCSQLLSHQQHYDWGLRPLKAVLRLGGSLLQRWKLEHPTESPSEATEAELMLQSLNINTLSKLTYDDARLFAGLLRDIFPRVEAREISYAELETAIATATKALGLQPIDSQVKKTLQLFEAMNQRTGVVLVGPSGSGKSTLLQILKKALELIGVHVPSHVMNPKAMSRRQLLGYMDPDTREWYDGVLTLAARDVVKQPKESRPWIVCDGDVDPEWIESLNSVLDDNKLLTMPNGVRIQFGANVNFLFETHSLEHASPATVSRMGVIFFSDRDIHLSAVVESVVAQQPEGVQATIKPLLAKYMDSAVTEVMRLNALSVPTTRMGLLKAGLNHVLRAVNEADFVYAMLRGLGSALEPAGALKFAEWLYKTSGVQPRSPSKPLDTFWNSKTNKAAEFVADVSREVDPAELIRGNAPVINITEVQRLMATINPLITDEACKPFFLVGPEGCGKGSVLQECFAAHRGIRSTFINCSAQTNASHVIEKIEQMCVVCNTSSGRVWRPKDGERLVLILKSLNLPKPDKYGTVQLHSFLLQLIHLRGFYNAELEWIGLERVQVVASMNPSFSAGRYPVAPRLLATVNTITMAYPSDAGLLQIYSTYWSQLLKRTDIGQGRDYDNGRELAQFVINVFHKVRRRFEGEEYAHCLFSPRSITNWVASTLLYKIDAQTTLPAVLFNEAERIFADCLPSPDDRSRAAKIFAEQLASLGYSVPPKEDRLATMYVTWFFDAAGNSGNRRLEQKTYGDVAHELDGALVRYSREYKQLDLTVIPEVVAWVTRVDRVLARPWGHLILVGLPGVGRRNAVTLAAYQQRMEAVTLNMGSGYNLKNFRNDLRSFIQRATVQNERIVLVLEDHNIIDESVLELVNGLVSSGEVPGLFSPEELESLFSPLREEAVSDGHMGSLYAYFVTRLRRNLRVALIMDKRHELFLVRLQSNPGLLSKSEVLWMGTWSGDVTRTVCKTRLREAISALEANPANKRFVLPNEMFHIHRGMGAKATPRDFHVLMESYERVVEGKSKTSVEKLGRLETGLSKLKEAEESVGKIQSDVSEKKRDVERMQREADKALGEIQKNMEASQEQRDAAKELQERLKEEHEDITVKRQHSEDELSGIKPMMEAARDAVSTIRSEQLSEIRSLKAPPEPIRDVLEGVLALLGITDVSWQSMRKFLGERGAKERILEFNVRSITPAIRASVAKLLQQKSNSFKPEVIHRASVAAAPMAEWVKAMVEYAAIMERIAPLTQQLDLLERNQRDGEEKLEGLNKKLRKIDKLVKELREEFASKCKEAERLRSRLEKAEAELSKAQDLLAKLGDEQKRWADDAVAIRTANDSVPRRALVAAAFMTYMGPESEDVRRQHLVQWSQRLGLPDVPMRLAAFMRTEGELLQFKAEGLPGDELSLENAVVVLDTVQTPLVIDPANQAIEWVLAHLKEHSAVVEVVSMSHERFAHALELAIRFGKTLLVTEVSEIDPVLYPVLRKDLTTAGAKRVVQVGGKSVEWQDTFKIILFSRMTDLALPPDGAALVAEVNFSVTSQGLESQLLGVTLQHEKPELEAQKAELLAKEDEHKLELSKLEVRLLRELADSSGNLLENAQLILSLNEVKTHAARIHESLVQFHALQAELDQKREVYRHFAHSGAVFFFIIKDLARLNRMYQFGLNDFITQFTRTLEQYKGNEEVAEKTSALVLSLAQRCFHHVALGLTKKDRAVFGLHLLRGLAPNDFPQDLWEALVATVANVKRVEELQLPSWVPLSSKVKLAVIMSCSAAPDIMKRWQLEDSARWSAWMQSETPVEELSSGANASVLTLMDKLLLINTFRADHMTNFCMNTVLHQLKLDSLVPNASLDDMLLTAGAKTPVLLITSSGADPSLEVQDIATHLVGKQRFTQIALGGGQTEHAMLELRRCAAQGDWLFLKNLHLVLDWASVLEKELSALTDPNPDFRLIITTESHELFPTVLLRMALKISVEAPPGVKQNLLRTYGSWDQAYLEAHGTIGAQALFGLAWFHAVIQERRTYVPQGWVKYYEFSPADLKAATDVLTPLVKASSAVDWVSLKGFLQTCVYGGRLDNPQDEVVLALLIDRYFQDDVLVRTRTPLYKDLTVPATDNYDAVLATLKSLPDVDVPAMFSLPDNADRAVLEHDAVTQIEGLRLLSQRSHAALEAAEHWRTLLAPVLELWRSSSIETDLPRLPPGAGTAGSASPDPMEVFFSSEAHLLSRLQTELAAYFGVLHAVCEGTTIPDATLRREAEELIGGRMPARWLDRMDGPKEAKLWLALLSRKYKRTVQLMRQPALTSTVLDLTNFLRPSTFLNALRQHTARHSKSALVDLVLVASIGKGGLADSADVRVTLSGSSMAIQGALVGSNGRLSRVTSHSPSLTPLTENITVGWITGERAAAKASAYTAISVYSNEERSQVIFPLSIPFENAEEAQQLSLNGVACFLVPA